VDQALLDELFEYIRIPSISSGGGDPHDLVRAARWLIEKIESSGGSAELVETPGNPLVDGRLEASDEGAPEILIYGHYDVQSPDPVGAWDSPPFEPEIREGRLYARGACDDKGNFYPLLYVACELKKAGRLPVNVRVVMEGEEEIGSPNISPWLERDEGRPDAAIIFDSLMLDDGRPTLTVATRGIIQFALDVSTGTRDLHSGLYGGSVLNATHVLHQILASLMPGPDGILRDELREGVVAPGEAEVASWSELPSGDEVLSSVGARPLTARSGATYYAQNGGEPSLDVNGIAGGDALQKRTIVPATANAIVSMRLAPQQSASRITQAVERLVGAATPEGAEITLDFTAASDPVMFDPTTPVLQLAAAALERACGKAPALVRIGGSIGALPPFAHKGIPVILSGFGVADDAFHAPNESYRVESLELGVKAAHELYAALATL
jgi:acetylornithine deacetylase/succinyl-diaminopimelate desuccinylase-like protein